MFLFLTIIANHRWNIGKVLSFITFTINKKFSTQFTQIREENILWQKS